MTIEFKEGVMKEWETFKRYGNKSLLTKIKKLLIEFEEHPETGTGKVEQLKGDLSGCWSRIINGEHRMIYEIDYDRNTVYVLSLKGHYEK